VLQQALYLGRVQMLLVDIDRTSQPGVTDQSVQRYDHVKDELPEAQLHQQLDQLLAEFIGAMSLDQLQGTLWPIDGIGGRRRLSLRDGCHHGAQSLERQADDFPRAKAGVQQAPYDPQPLNLVLRIDALIVAISVRGGKTIAPADRNFKRPSGPRLPTTVLRVTSLRLRPSLGAAWLAWKIWPPVAFGAEPLAVAGPASQRGEPRRPQGAHAGLRCSLGQAGPYRLAKRSMKSGLILPFTAGWTAQAARAPRAAARSDAAPAQHPPGATVSSQ
jgi:hypothetical protein